MKQETVPLLISLCKQRDYGSQMTAVKVIAELAEEAKNRKPLYLQAVMPTLFECIRKGDDEMRFQCARAIADMAEAVELRVGIVYAGLEQILECMLSDDDAVQEQGMRTLVNLAAPAGFACGADEGGVGRYGALEALQVDDEGSENESSSEEDDSDASGEGYEYEDRDIADSDAASDSSDESSDEAGLMDSIADQMDDMELHRPRSVSPTKLIPAGATTSGLMGLAMGMAPAAAGGAEGSSSEEEEDDFDEVEEPEPELEEEEGSSSSEEDSSEDYAPPVSSVLARARLLVHKAAIMEGEKSRGLNNNSVAAAAAVVSSEKKLAMAASARMGKGVSKPTKGFKLPTKAESQFSRYRRQSAFTIAEEKRREDAVVEEAAKIKARPQVRRLSVGWGDMATLVGATTTNAVDEQSHEWWSTDEGGKFREK